MNSSILSLFSTPAPSGDLRTLLLKTYLVCSRIVSQYNYVLLQECEPFDAQNIDNISVFCLESSHQNFTIQVILKVIFSNR